MDDPAGWLRRLQLLRQRIPPHQWLLGLAVPIGVICGLIACAYRAAIAYDRGIFSPHWTEGRGWAAAAATIGFPVAGGLLISFARKALSSNGRPPHGMTDLVRSLITGDYRALTWKTFANSLLSLVTIKSGGSAGPEGPISEMGGLVGVAVGRFIGLSAREIPTVAACGLASGIAAIFNAPLAGILFALEIVLGDLVLTSAAPIVLSAVTGSAISRIVFGEESIFPRSVLYAADAFDLPLFAFLGVFGGLVAAAFSTMLTRGKKLWPTKVLRSGYGPLVGGLLMGLITLAVPRVHGEGYLTIVDLIRMKPVEVVLPLLILVRMLATGVTLTSGSPGGAFAPSLVVGSILGTMFGQACFFLGGIGSTQAISLYTLAGMAGVLSGVFLAPLTSLMVVFEVTGYDSRVILPVLATVATSAVLSRSLIGAGFYDRCLAEDGFDRASLRGLTHLAGRTVGDTYRRGTPAVVHNQDLLKVLETFALGEGDALLTVNDRDEVTGIISVGDLRQAMGLASVPELVLAHDITTQPAGFLSPDLSLIDFRRHLDTAGVGDEAILLVIPEGAPRELPIPRSSVLGTLSGRDLTDA